MIRSLQKLHHRGPDDSRQYQVGAAILGHRRLSIIDLGGSQQPMSDPTKRYWLTYNGEIYNYLEVRAALKDRWTFRTQGDTEVLLAGLALEGEKFLDRLEGMWAFAFWDSQTERLFLCRDRMGKKPLFYQLLEHGHGLAAASELPALRELVAESWHEDSQALFDYLNYGYTMPGYTMVQEVREILPGHFAYWKPGANFQQRAWWKLRVRQFASSRNNACQELRVAVTEAVRKRLIADVEVGAFLSGGIDSSLICAITRRDLNTQIKTFTIGFDDATFDERRFARLIADQYALAHHEEILPAWNESDLETLLLKHVGQPFADSSLLPTALVSQLAARHVKVALSGDGGDELFSGYQRYHARNILLWYSRLPGGLRKFAYKAVRSLPEPAAHHSRSLLKKAHLFMDIIDRQQSETPYFAAKMFPPHLLERLAPELPHHGHPPPGIPEETELDDIGRMMFADALIYLPQDILSKVDRASMAYSLETRAPFLDRRVVELAFSLPRHWHRNWRHGKRLLKNSFRDLLPNEIWVRRKQGFGAPIHHWFRGDLGDRLLTLARADRDNPLSATGIEELLHAHRQYNRDHGYRLWLLYAYLLWRAHQQGYSTGSQHST